MNDIPRIGSVSRLTFCQILGKGKRTVDRWINDGLSGIKLPTEQIGARVFISWPDYHQWQQRIKDRKKPIPRRRKTCAAAKRVLEEMGYTK